MTPGTTTSIFAEEDKGTIKARGWLGFWNGLALGLALVAGVWGYQAYTVSDVPVAMPFGALISNSLIVLLTTTFVGWLTARVNRTLLTILLWFLVALFASSLIGVLSSRIDNLLVWLADSRFWGRQIYESRTLDSAFLTLLSQMLAGIFLILVFFVASLTQEYRLEGFQASLSSRGWPTASTFLNLLVPMIFVAVAGLVTSSITGASAASESLSIVHEVIETGRDYEGNLNELSLERGVNYNAIRGVREQMQGDYVLALGSSNPESDTTFIIAEFENGAWIICRVFAGSLSFCSEGSAPYTVGFQALITGDPPPDDCPACLPRAEDSVIDWLSERRARFPDQPQISRVAYWGEFVLMRAESSDGEYAIECWFNGLSPTHLESCQEAGE